MRHGVCVARSCCCGFKGLVEGAKVMALIDIVINIFVLSTMLLMRNEVNNPPTVFKTLFWVIFLIFVDVLLLQGLRHKRPVTLIIWQTVFLFHIISLAAFSFFLAAFELGNMNRFLGRKASLGETGRVKVVLLIMMVGAVCLVPYYIYFMYIVNGAKAVVRRVALDDMVALRLEANNASSSGNMYRRHSCPETDFLHQITVGGSGGGGLGRPRRGSVDQGGPSKWTCQEIIEPVRISSKTMLQSQLPIYQVQAVDPMTPFQPLYHTRRTSQATISLADNEFILPLHLRSRHSQ